MLKDFRNFVFPHECCSREGKKIEMPPPTVSLSRLLVFLGKDGFDCPPLEKLGRRFSKGPDRIKTKKRRQILRWPERVQMLKEQVDDLRQARKGFHAPDKKEIFPGRAPNF